MPGSTNNYVTGGLANLMTMMSDGCLILAEPIGLELERTKLNKERGKLDHKRPCNI